MPHSARRVLCTPVLRSLRSRSWLKAQITELRSAVTCSSTCLTRKESGVNGEWEAAPSSALRSSGMADTRKDKSNSRDLKQECCRLLRREQAGKHSRGPSLG